MTETDLHILETAMRLFATKGFKETSMADIVATSGVSKGGIYWHFKSKSEIIAAVYRQIFEVQEQFLTDMLSGEGKASDRLRQIITFVDDSLVESMPQPLDIYAYALRQPELLEQLTNFFESYQTKLADLIRQGVSDGEFKTHNPEEAAFVILSSIEGLILMCSMTGKPLATMLSTQIEIILRGLR